MENQLIQIYLFVCHIYDTSSATCFQRLSNNREPSFTDQEIITIWFFAHLSGCSQKKQMHEFIKNYWLDWFPHLPSYQTFVYRLNQLEASLQTCGKWLFALLDEQSGVPEADQIIDSLPVMLAANGHSYSGRVAREVAAVGYCAAKKTRFHGVRLHFTAQRCTGRLPLPRAVWLCAAAVHDSRAVKEQAPIIKARAVFGDLAYLDKQLRSFFKAQACVLITPQKKPKGGDLTAAAKYHNRLVSKFRQPIESLFNWIIEKTNIQKAGKVRSTNALLIHCWENWQSLYFCSFSTTDSHTRVNLEYASRFVGNNAGGQQFGRKQNRSSQYKLSRYKPLCNRLNTNSKSKEPQFYLRLL